MSLRLRDVVIGGLSLHAVLVCAGCTESTPAAIPPASPSVVAAADRPATDNAEKQGARHTRRTAGWISVAIGTEAAIVALATSGMMLHEKSLRDDGCGGGTTCTQAGLDANSQLRALGGWNAAAYLVAAAGLGVGIFLVVTNPADEPTPSPSTEPPPASPPLPDGVAPAPPATPPPGPAPAPAPAPAAKLGVLPGGIGVGGAF